MQHAQLDLRGAFDSTSGAAEKTKSTLRDVAKAAVAFADATRTKVIAATGVLLEGLFAQVDLLKGLEATVPGLEHAFDSIIAALEREIANPAIRPNRKAAGTIAGPARAGGGPVMAGMTYTIGERGPEQFMPLTSGNIVPNGGGGKTVLNATVVVSETDSGDRLVRKLVQAVNSGHGKADLRRALGINN